MKKIFNILLAVAATMLVACNGKAKDEVRVYSESAAEKAIAMGVFEGTWTRIAEDGSSTADGTIEFIKSDTTDLAVLSVKSADFSLDKTCLVNASHAADDIVFVNNKATNSFGAPVYGRIVNAYGNGEKAIKLDFKIEQQEGRFTKTFEYSFSPKAN